MLKEITQKEFKQIFINDPHPFISIPFIDLNSNKVEKIVYLVEKDKDKINIGLIVGIKNGLLLSPFSAPYGGFHFKKENIYIGEIDQFLQYLKQYIVTNKLKGINLTLPSSLYHESFNSKTVNSLCRNDFIFKTPDINNHIDLEKIKENFKEKSSRKHYNQAIRNKLSFNQIYSLNEKEEVYYLVVENRKKFNRPIHMSFEDVMKTCELFETDFFQIEDMEKELVASAIFYRFEKEKVIHAVFWGDNERGRPLRAIDFLTFESWKFYKKLGYKYVDLGISTESSIPNEGLLRFKETHEGISTLKYSFYWYV